MFHALTFLHHNLLPWQSYIVFILVWFDILFILFLKAQDKISYIQTSKIHITLIHNTRQYFLLCTRLGAGQY